MRFSFRLQGTTWDEVSDQDGVWGEVDDDDVIDYMLEYLKERMKGNWWDSALQRKVGKRLKRRK